MAVAESVHLGLADPDLGGGFGVGEHPLFDVFVQGHWISLYNAMPHTVRNQSALNAYNIVDRKASAE